ncbi:hypothetical protein BT63DRAFT_427329 [Microthyrium microscopicum]|uniref:DUF1308 domain-containing protein n=1 Tax=Microthyrium microscopicum TaxID=703497 RepID=A0A6A6U645_9PEZI|nr:hypothetical protein BT63DRAFT_427329 [Microthyrium microscopicum]
MADLISAEMSSLALLESDTKKRIQDARNLLAELDFFLAIACSEKKFDINNAKAFRSRIITEIRNLEKLSSSRVTDQDRIKLDSSNLSFFEAIWNVAKQSAGVTGIRSHLTANYTIKCDIVAEGGSKLIKVLTISEKRLLYEMAAQGWHWDDPDSDSETESDEEHGREKDDDLPELSLFKIARALIDQVKDTRVRYRRPRLVLTLTRLREGSVSAIDTILTKIRSMGVEIVCGNNLPPPISIQDALSTMLYDDTERLTKTLNVDCTLLLALVSDITNSVVQEKPSFNRALKRQLEIEAKEQLLLNVLGPIIKDRKLVCSYEAAKTMRDITEFIGTPTERARLETIMAKPEDKRSQKEVQNAFQQYSCYHISDSWNFPIEIWDDVAIDDPRLPEFASEAVSGFNPVTKSVFLNGWAHGITTITSNKGAVCALQRDVEAARQSNEEVGPEVWFCKTSRSLMAKEKDRRDASSQKALE